MSDLDPQTANRLIEHAGRELLVRQQELALHEKQEETRRLEIEKNSEIAIAQLAAQERDLSDQRRQFNEMLRRRHRFIVAVLIILIMFSGYAIYAGAKEMIVEILKTALAFSAGGFGGYHYGKSKQDK